MPASIKVNLANNTLAGNSEAIVAALNDAGVGTSAWGAITGTLGDQEDLAAALVGKADTASLAPVATSGAYSDLTGKPVIGTDVLAPDGTGAALSDVLHPNGDPSQVALGDTTYKALGDFVLFTDIGTAVLAPNGTADSLTFGGTTLGSVDGIVKMSGGVPFGTTPDVDYVVPLTAAYNMGSGLSGTFAPDLANGPTQYFDATGNLYLSAPTGSPIEGVTEMWLVLRYQSAAGAMLHLDGIHPDLLSALSFPLTLDQWKSYILQLRFHGGVWCLVSFTQHDEVVD